MASQGRSRGISTKDLKANRSVKQAAPPGRSNPSVRSSAPARSKRTPSVRQRPVPSQPTEPKDANLAPSEHTVHYDATAEPLVPEVLEVPEVPEQKAPEQYRPLSPKEKRAIKKRAEERIKVPYKFRDSVKRFFFSPTGMLKVLRLGLIIGALSCFINVKAHESFIAITFLETCIVIAFILIYMITLHHLLPCLHWPLLDLMNSIITAAFLFIVAILAMQEKNRRRLFYIGGSLCLAATVVCGFDAFVVTKKMRSALKSLLQIKDNKTSAPRLRQSKMHLSSAPYSHPANY